MVGAKLIGRLVVCLQTVHMVYPSTYFCVAIKEVALSPNSDGDAENYRKEELQRDHICDVTSDTERSENRNIFILILYPYRRLEMVI